VGGRAKLTSSTAVGQDWIETCEVVGIIADLAGGSSLVSDCWRAVPRLTPARIVDFLSRVRVARPVL